MANETTESPSQSYEIARVTSVMTHVSLSYHE